MSVSFSPSTSTYDLLKDSYGPFITLPDAAQIVGNHVSTWYKWISDNTMPVPTVTVGNNRRIRLIDLCNYLDSQASSNTAPAAEKPAGKRRGRPRKYNPALASSAS